MGQVCLDGEVIRLDAIQVGLDPWAEGAEGIQSLGACPLAIGELQVAGAHVVNDGEAEHHVFPVGAVNVLAGTADDDCQLALEFHLGGPLGDANRSLWAHHCCRWLEEDGGRKVLGTLLEHLGHVIRVVATHGHDLGGENGSEEANVLDWPGLTGELRLAKGVSGDLSTRGAGSVRLTTFEYRECHAFRVGYSSNTHESRCYLTLS